MRKEVDNVNSDNTMLTRQDKTRQDKTRQDKTRQGKTRQISVIGSLNPTKDCQDRVRVFSIQGICPAIRATDYKDPPKICVRLE